MPITLVGAYGRRYKSKEAVLKDWNDGKDFRIVCGPYTSIRDKDLLHKDYGTIIISYDNGWKSLVIDN